jgi:hypothetical protein
VSYGKIHSRFWTDKKVRGWSESARLLAIYLISGPHRNLLGACRVPDGYIAADMGWSERRTSEVKAELGRAGFALFGDDGWLFVVNQLRYDPLDNPNQARSAIKLFEAIDDQGVRAAAAGRLLEALERFKDQFDIHKAALQSVIEQSVNGSETVSEGSPTPSLSSSLPDHPPAGADEFDSEFEPIWEIYPRKVGKGAARRAFRAARKKTDLASIVSGIKRMPLPSDPKYIPHLATWLNHERWSDGAVQAIGAPAAGGSLWQQRMATYRPGKFWPSSWGPPPDDPMCECPAEILTEWKRRLERAA